MGPNTVIVACRTHRVTSYDVYRDWTDLTYDRIRWREKYHPDIRRDREKPKSLVGNGNATGLFQLWRVERDLGIEHNRSTNQNAPSSFKLRGLNQPETSAREDCYWLWVGPQ